MHDPTSGKPREHIRAAAEEDGPRSPELIALLNELAMLYETEGRHAQASAALEEARQLVRVNYGLHTLEQVPLLEQALENQQALGNLAMVRALEEQLLTLAWRHPTDLRSAAIHRGVGERRLNLLRRFLADEYPAEIYPEVGFWSFSKSQMTWELVWEAQAQYGSAAAVLLANGLYSSDELRNLERELIRTASLLRERSERAISGVGNAGDAHNAYRLGMNSYRRLVHYEEVASATSPAADSAWQSRWETELERADWNLLYSRNGAALDAYTHALEVLSTANVEPLIAEFFAPPLPIVLPAFLPNPLRTETSARYIDVAFEITRYGESRRVEVVDAAPNVTDDSIKTLVSLVKNSRFRPRATDGELGRASPVAIRYYLSE